MLRVAGGWRVLPPLWRPAATCMRCYSSRESNKTPSSPWDELFASQDVGETPDVAPEVTPALPRSVLHARERPHTRRMPRARSEYDTSSLTHAESQQFRRIFQLLEEEMGHDAPKAAGPYDDGLELFATRNALAPRKVTARGGGVGTRFHAVPEGAAASVPPEVMERGVDAIWEALQAQPDAAAAWTWAEAEVWDVHEGDATYGPRTPFFAPALHMLLLTLRDRLQAPHTALAVVPATRALGAAPYVLGCTAALYAEVLRTQWLCLHDIYAVLGTVREARQAGILADLDDASASPAEYARRDDAPLREYIDRVRNEARGEIIRRVEGGADVDQRLSRADRDVLRVVNELRRIAGHTSRYRAKPGTLRAERTPSPRRPRRPRQATQQITPKIYPADLRGLLRS